VKRCSSKQVDVVSLGALRLDDGWHNAGYIFPDGFTTATVFRSSVSIHTGIGRCFAYTTSCAVFCASCPNNTALIYSRQSLLQIGTQIWIP
jgi:hypothetical protein